MAKMASMYAEQFEVPTPQAGETISFGRTNKSYTITRTETLSDGKMLLTLVAGTGRVVEEVIDPQVFVRRR